MAAKRKPSRRDPNDFTRGSGYRTTKFIRGSGYRIPRLSKTEFATLEWLSARGYDRGILDAAGVSEEFPDGSVQLGDIREHEAWSIRDNIEEDRHAFLTSSGSDSLNQILWDFEDSIV